MPDCLDYSQTHRFSKLMLDYLNQNQSLSSFYNRFPLPSSLELQLKEKQSTYHSEFRISLINTLRKQYKPFQISAATQSNIALLGQNNTYTITTGHQLNLFTGPLYTFYKITSVLNSCKILKAAYPGHNFVPVFWLASEDHDFEEINYFNYKDSKLEWDTASGGAVGEKNTKGLEQVYELFKNQLSTSSFSEELAQLFRAAYLQHKSLSEATIYLYNTLFGKQGLVILEPNVKALKSLFTPYIKKEILEEITFKKVTSTTEKLKTLNYHEQVTPREINFFYKTKGLRERIIRKKEYFFINNTTLKFSKAELLQEIDNFPERFSPNALLRPLYQEVVLPNLSYVGGGGELAYWLQLKSTFEAFDVTFPCLQLRNSALLYTEKTRRKLEKMKMSLNDVFLPSQNLIDGYVQKASEINIDFTPQKEHLKTQFKDLYTLAEQTDKSFLGAVAAQEKKQLNGLDNLEKRLLRAQRRKLKADVDRLKNLQLDLFPNHNLQERVINFSEVYELYGSNFIDFLIEHLDPFDYRFLLLQLENYLTSLKH